ncbi:MAG: hypothetical protein ACKVPX_06215 [Myxococcaceae bacterium]
MPLRPIRNLATLRAVGAFTMNAAQQAVARALDDVARMFNQLRLGHTTWVAEHERDGEGMTSSLFEVIRGMGEKLRYKLTFGPDCREVAITLP